MSRNGLIFWIKPELWNEMDCVSFGFVLPSWPGILLDAGCSLLRHVRARQLPTPQTQTQSPATARIQPPSIGKSIVRTDDGISVETRRQMRLHHRQYFARLQYGTPRDGPAHRLHSQPMSICTIESFLKSRGHRLFVFFKSNHEFSFLPFTALSLLKFIRSEGRSKPLPNDYCTVDLLNIRKRCAHQC